MFDWDHTLASAPMYSELEPRFVNGKNVDDGKTRTPKYLTTYLTTYLNQHNPGIEGDEEFGWMDGQGHERVDGWMDRAMKKKVDEDFIEMRGQEDDGVASAG